MIMKNHHLSNLARRGVASLLMPDIALDQLCPPVKYLHRRRRDAELYCFFNESAAKQSRMAMLAGRGQTQVLDAASGRTEVLAGASPENDAVRVPLALEPCKTKFIVVGK